MFNKGWRELELFRHPFGRGNETVEYRIVCIKFFQKGDIGGLCMPLIFLMLVSLLDFSFAGFYDLGT